MDATYPPQPPYPTQHGGWFARNWKWFVALIVVGLLLVAGAVVGIFALVFSLIKSSEVYTHALAQARADPQVVAVLGEPIEEGFMPSGSIEISGGSGNADLSITIHGPKGSATIYVVATRQAGRWTYDILEVALPGSAERIDLSGGGGP